MKENFTDIKQYAVLKKEYYKDTILANNLHLSLAIFQVGDNPASNKYVANKIKDCESVGITCTLYKYDPSISESDFLEDIALANSSRSLTGIIVQLPLPPHISEEKVKLAIDPSKDVDGFHPLSKTNPATPQGIITYLEDQHYDFVNKNVLILGRSNIVGRPLARMFLDRSSNVTVVHSKTSERTWQFLLSQTDLIICATGHRNTITDDSLKYITAANQLRDIFVDAGYYTFANQVLPFDYPFIIDVGINFNEEGKMVGDCENVTLADKTPVPGGVGLLTRLAVIENLIKLS